MTIYRFDRISAAQIDVQYASANDPDLISVEALFEGNGLFSIDMTADGKVSILFDEITNAEFDLAEFQELVSRYATELEIWRSSLIKPGEIWEAFS